MKAWKIIVILILLIIAVFMGLMVSKWLEYLNTPLIKGDQSVRILVKPGTSMTALAQQLQQQGVINKPGYFTWLARFSGVTKELKAGEYVLQPGIKPKPLLKMIVAGKVLLHSFTIIEGWNFNQLMTAINANPNFKHELTGLTAKEIAQRVGIEQISPEGWFYPDTYRYPAKMTDLQFLKWSYQTMVEKLQQQWQDREQGLLYKDPYQGLIIASMVQKEGQLNQEMPMIAGVIQRRLQKGMVLQIDSTVMYGLNLAPNARLTRKDLRTDTPYNTYLRRGLPPTPIAMPGLNALHAAFHPSSGDYLYFVARGDGSHYFSATLKQHNRAVAKYQLGEQGIDLADDSANSAISVARSMWWPAHFINKWLWWRAPRKYYLHEA